MKMLTRISYFIRKLYDPNGLAQELNQAWGDHYHAEGMPELCREAAADGIVLLKNDGVLPLKRGENIAVFGRCQVDYFCVGYGSGGDVKATYRKDFAAGMEEAAQRGDIHYDQVLFDAYKSWTQIPKNEKDDGFWGFWPMNYPEMPLQQSLVDEAAKKSQVALVVIGRAAGEDRENKLEKSSYYLTDLERDMLQKVTSTFEKTVVVMDCGNVVNLSWLEEYPISALVYAWQGGMEAGTALWDVLCGRVNPSGRLTDTIAKTYVDYPSSGSFGGKEYNNYTEDIFVGYRYFETFARDRVLFPFGYGLSYTTFQTKVLSVAYDDSDIRLQVQVHNIGRCAGKEVVQVYVRAPQGRLGKAERVLVGFGKTGLLASGEEAVLDITFSNYDCTSYDEKASAYVLEPGDYEIFVGNNVRDAEMCGVFQIRQEQVLRSLQSVCQVKNPFDRMVNLGGKPAFERVLVADYDLRQRILEQLPEAIPYTGDQGYTLEDVRSGRITLEQFIGQLTNDELEALTRGYGIMDDPEGTQGNAGGFGGVIPSLQEKGVPRIITCDGPSGIRLSRFASLLPCGTAIASTWDVELAEKLYTAVSQEMQHYNVDILLGPGMNIHRNPLCGRNFEYYAEDPVLTGRIAAAVVRGIQNNGRSACVKHFAANNQETRRNRNDSRVSERALREIYLKGFEICICEAEPNCLMMSYNKVNGVWAHYSFDLAQTVLRKEWGFKGLILTDWWMQKGVSPEFPKVQTNAYRIRAGVDVLMPGNMNRMAREYRSDGTTLPDMDGEGLTRGELTETACRVLNFILKVKR